MLPVEPPFVVHRGRTSTGVEAIASVPLEEYEGSMRQGARQMVFAALSGGPEANRAIRAVEASAQNPDDPNHGYSVIMWYLLCAARREADQFGKGQTQQAPAASPGPSVAGAPQPAPQAWAPPVGAPQAMPQPQPQYAGGGGGGGGAAARSYSRVKTSGQPMRDAREVRTGAVKVGGASKVGPAGVRLETRVIRGGAKPAAPAAAPAAAPTGGKE